MDCTDSPASAGNLSVVACLGDSITQATWSFDWIRELGRRPQNRRYSFCNFGVGGDLSYNTLQRVNRVINCRPDKVVIHIGQNDILPLVSRLAGHFFALWKLLPAKPSAEWFRRNLQATVRLIKVSTTARIGLVSLSQIGEEPHSPDPLQSELNALIAKFNLIIRDVAEAEGAVYIPFYERLHDMITAEPGRAFTDFSVASTMLDDFRILIQGRSLDEIAAMNGWRFHTDGMHLNSRAGMVFAGLVQEFLDS